MEQHTYHGGNTMPDQLADFLIKQYEHDERLQAQKLGEGQSFIIQIGRRDPEHAQDRAITIGITHGGENNQDIIVTIGSQQWLNHSMNGGHVLSAMIGALFTPWALFGLLWPLTEALTGGNRIASLWEQIDIFMVGQGATLVNYSPLAHPHAEGV